MSKLYFSSGRDESTGRGKDPRTGEGYMDLWVSELDKKGISYDSRVIRNTDYKVAVGGKSQG